MNRLPTQYPLWLRYGVAVACVGVGSLGRIALTPTVGPTALPFIFFFPTLAAAAWFGGFGPSLVAIGLSVLAATWFFIEPFHTFAIHATYDAVALGAFVVAALFIAGAIEAMHRARIGLEHEMDERKRAQDELTQSRELLATTLASIGDGVIVTDADERVTFLNAEAERLTGWSNYEAAKLPLAAVFRIVNELTRQPAENPVAKVLRLGTVVGLGNHTLLIARDGTERPIDDSAAPIRQSGRSISGVVLVFRDISNSRKAEEARTRLAAIVEGSADAILAKDMDGIIRTWNPGAQRLFGYQADEIIGQHVTRLIPPEHHAEETEIMDRLRRGLPTERVETTRLTKDGRRIQVSLRVSPLLDPEGRIIGASKILHDVTELVAAREALMQQKELLATTLASIGDGVIVTDAEGRVTFVNAEAERLTRWQNVAARGLPVETVFNIVNEHTRRPAENPVSKVRRLGTVTGLANHTVLIARDGTETLINDSAAPIRQPGGPFWGVVLVFRATGPK